ncbi:ATP-binding protein [Saccharopolyspora gregorii]|uniref:ATP-binding protein n=1 Tax=Saccharopolyspora gregorii TaxID=33914 RepID=UPI0021AD3D60|nr:BTAD domain-containing putative transcriptional regulator [Saccharopolyspora gregorii]
MRVAMLGPFRLRAADGEPVEVGGRRVRALIARLALDAGRPVPADTLIADLWGAAQPAAAVNALQTLVSRARRATGDLRLTSTAAGYVLDVAGDDVDVHRFDRLVATGRARLRSGEAAGAADVLREALALWRGDPLVDVADAAFAAPHVARLDEARLGAREDRIEADLRLGRHADLIPELDGLCARHPLRERLIALRLRALHAAGRRADALAAYEAHRSRLADDLGTDPSASLTALRAELLRDEPAPPPAPAAHQALPVRLSSFVGREAEIAQVGAALARSRLVTLFGPGGAGKTRLATEIAAEITGHRVWFAELAPVRDGGDLTAAVLAALGIRETRLLEAPQSHGAARLAEALGAEPAVLVLDNCEHVIEEAAGFAHELLGRRPELRVLATSREPLALPGEELLPVGPLALPADGTDPAAAAAVRLFADRAAAASPGFELTERTAPDVVEVCRRLDGIPLAIELAAARLRSMPLRQIAARLDDRFRLLTGGNRAAMPRHRTLRAVVEWSWDLLDERERRLAARMAVFTGAVRAESVTAVCADDELPAADVFYVLSSLVEKSLVTAVENGRYRMLETVRAYCWQRCLDDGAADRARDAHLAHFLAVAEETEPGLHGPEQLDLMDRLDADHDNLLAALHRAVDAGDADRGLRLVAALSWYWSMSAWSEEVLARFTAVAELPGPAAPQARAVVRLGRALAGTGDGWFEQVRDGAVAAAESGAMHRYPHSALLEAGAWLFLGEFTELRRVVELAAAHPDPWVRATAVFEQAISAEHGGDPRTAEEHMRTAADAFRRIGDRWGRAQSISSLAGYRSLRGDHAGAIDLLAEALETIRQLRSDVDLVAIMVRIGVERVRAGDFGRGRAELERAGEIAARGRPWFAVWALTGLAECARLEGGPDEAERYLDEAERIGTDEQEGALLRPALLRQRAGVLLDRGRPDEAPALLAKALDGGAGIRSTPEAAAVAECAARWRWNAGDQPGAARLLGLAVALRGALDEGDPDLRRTRDGLASTGEPHRAVFDAATAQPRAAALAELRSALDRDQR